MQTWRSILTATTVMTLHALALSAMAPSSAHGRSVYRCTGSGNQISYQAQPCAGHAASSLASRQQQLHVADTRTDDQLRHALDNRRRDGFDVPRAEAIQPASRRAKKKAMPTGDIAQAAEPARKARTRQRTQATRQTKEPSARAGALTSHRFGERPFEHVGTPLSDAAPRRKDRNDQRRRDRTKDFTARAPADEPGTRVKARN